MVTDINLINLALTSSPFFSTLNPFYLCGKRESLEPMKHWMYDKDIWSKVDYSVNLAL